MSVESSGRPVRVLIHEDEPYYVTKNSLERKSAGFYEKIWQAIKAEMVRPAETDGAPSGERNYVFEETRVSDPRAALGTERYDIVVALNHPSSEGAVDLERAPEQKGGRGAEGKRSATGWKYSSPLFLRNYSVVYVMKGNVVSLFYKILFQKYIPVVLVFVLISVFLGLFLYRFTPRKNRRNAIWQTLSGMMGELGYLSEKLSDRHKKVSWWGYVVNLIVLMCCLYGFVYMQATINTTMIYAKDKIQTPSNLTQRTLDRNTRVLVHPQLLRGSPDAVLAGMGISLTPIRDQGANRAAETGVPSAAEHTRLALDAYKALANTEGSSPVDGVLVDTIAYNYVRGEKAYKDTKSTDHRIGQHAISLAVDPLQTGLLYDLNASIHRLHSRREIQSICKERDTASTPVLEKHCVL